MPVLLSDYISAEGLEPGERLPPERDLAVKLGISRTALRRMLSQLEDQGKLVRHVGRGTFIADGPFRDLGQTEAQADSKVLRTYPAEVFETRRIFEPQAAALAALRASQYEINDMKQAIDRGRQAGALSEFEHWDAVFHRAVMRAARNDLISHLYETIHTVRSGQLWGRMKEQSLTPETMSLYIDQHDLILQAVSDRNASLAEKHMADHIREAESNILGRR